LHEDIRAYIIISHSVIHRMRNVSDKGVEKILPTDEWKVKWLKYITSIKADENSNDA